MKDTNLSWTYVDDSINSVNLNSANPDFRELENIIDKLQQWTSASDVTIIIAITVVIHINLETLSTEPPTVTIGTKILQAPRCHKANELNWKAHVTTVTKITTLRL